MSRICDLPDIHEEQCSYTGVHEVEQSDFKELNRNDSHLAEDDHRRYEDEARHARGINAEELTSSG